MKLTAYLATSADGYIATNGGDSSWISNIDTGYSRQMAQEFGCAIIGRIAFSQYYGSFFPLPAIPNYVLTTDPARKDTHSNVIYTGLEPTALVKELTSKNLTQALILGGSKTVTSFVKAKLLNELIISIHPRLFSRGLPILAEDLGPMAMQLMEANQYGLGLVRLRYHLIYA